MSSTISRSHQLYQPGVTHRQARAQGQRWQVPHGGAFMSFFLYICFKLMCRREKRQHHLVVINVLLHLNLLQQDYRQHHFVLYQPV